MAGYIWMALTIVDAANAIALRAFHNLGFGVIVALMKICCVCFDSFNYLLFRVNIIAKDFISSFNAINKVVEFE